MSDAKLIPKRPGCILGIDVARYQAGLDMDLVRERGCSFVIAKATQGIETTDPSFYRFAAEASQNVLHSGAYHFFEPGKDPRRQADVFSRTAEDAVNMIPTLDFETLKGVDVLTASRRALEWIEHVERIWSSRVVFYSNPNFIATSMDPDIAAEIAKRCDLWIAHYTNRPKPLLPFQWEKWQAWQFDGDAGFVFETEDGKSIDCDFNWYNGSIEDFAERWVRGPRP